MLEECCLGGSLMPPPYVEPPPAYTESPPPAYEGPGPVAPRERVVVDSAWTAVRLQDQEDQDMRRALAESLLPQPVARAKRPPRGLALHHAQVLAEREAAAAEAIVQAEERAQRAKKHRVFFDLE